MSGGSVYSLFCLALVSIAAMAFHPTEAATRAGSDGEQTLDGVWVSRGYGWLWEIDDGRVERFDIGEGFCIPKPSRREFVVRRDNLAELSDAGRTLRLRLQDPDYFYTFDRVAEVPVRCRQPASATPDSVLDVFVEAFDAHYAFFAERGVDWESAVETARSKLDAGMSDAALFEVLGELVSLFRDGHVGLEAEIDGGDASIFGSAARGPIQTEGRPAIAGAWNVRAAVESLDGTRCRGDDTLVYGQLAEDIGYLQVRSMSGMDTDELEAALDDIMTSFAGSEAVIVDVSRNSGGYDSFARIIARRFAAAPTVAYSKHAGDHEGASPQEIVLQPPERPGFVGPVYLITSRRTASAAEIFAMSMRALPNVVHLGEATEGSLSDILSKRLPNGWVLNLSNEVYLDSEGVLWEGRGIQPEIPLALSEDDSITPEDEQSILDLLHYIRMRPRT